MENVPENNDKGKREQATVLRQSGASYSSIKTKLGIPKSTLSKWFKDQAWSEEVTKQAVNRAKQAGAMRLMVLNTVRGNRLKKIYEEARQDALGDFSELKFHPLFMAGVLLYLAKGDKTSRVRVCFSSSNPKEAKMFDLFLKRVCRIEKIKYNLLLPVDAPEADYKAFWIEKAGFEPSKWGKSIRIKRKSPKLGHFYGVCNVVVNSAYLKSKILKWIDLLADEIGQETYIAGIV